MLILLARIANISNFKPILIEDKLYLVNKVVHNPKSIYELLDGSLYAWTYEDDSYTWDEITLIPINSPQEDEEALLRLLPYTPLESDTHEMVENLLHIIKTAPSWIIGNYIAWVSKLKEYPNVQESIDFFRLNRFKEITF